MEYTEKDTKIKVSKNNISISNQSTPLNQNINKSSDLQKTINKKCDGLEGAETRSAQSHRAKEAKGVRAERLSDYNRAHSFLNMHQILVQVVLLES